MPNLGPFKNNTVQLPFPDQKDWNIFPLGVDSNNEEVTWDSSAYPHLFIAGSTGVGKGVTLRTLLMHAFQSPDWRVTLVDPKGTELPKYDEQINVLDRAATSLEDALTLITNVEEEIQYRYNTMKEANVDFF